MKKSAAGVFLDTISKTPDINLGEGIPNEKRVRDIVLSIIESLQTVSIQTVLAEVDVVIYNDDDLETNLDDGSTKISPLYIGCIKVTPSVPFPILPTGGPGWIYPLDANVKSYPIKGELVAIVNYGAQTFYCSPTNILNSVNHNLRVGMTELSTKGKSDFTSKAASFFESDDGGYQITDFPRPVKQFPGDWAVNGRNDQSIRIGKTGGTKEDSVIKIRIAENETEGKNTNIPLEENPNEDQASIYLTRNETISLNVVPNAGSEVTPKEFSGAQILVDSDTLTFNSKDGDVNIYSANRFNFVSKNKVNLVGSSVTIGDVGKVKYAELSPDGDNTNLQHAVCGESLVEWLSLLCDELVRFGNKCAGATGIGNLGITVPIPGLMSGGSGLAIWCQEQSKGKGIELKRKFLSSNVAISRTAKRDL